MKILRPYQQDAVTKLWEAFDKDEKSVLAAPTGAGKTALAARIFLQAREKGLRVAFCVPFLSLLDQTFMAFIDEGLDEDEMSLVQADNPLRDYSKPIQICSVDTLVRRHQLPEVDIVVFDECHRQSKLYARWMKEAPSVKFAGLSATPWAKGMADLWDDLIIVETTRGLIDKGYLSEYKYFAPTSPDLTGVRILAGDYHEGELGRAMNRPELIADIVRTWTEKAENRPTLCFCVTREHAKEVQSQFLKSGTPAGYCDAYSSIKERKQLIEQLRIGELKIIVNVGVLTTGLDAPFVSAIILARPTRSEMLFIQIVGRGLRKNTGKDNCLILDHSDSGLNLGLPCAIHHEALLNGKTSKAAKAKEREERKDRTLKPHKCVKCNHLHDQAIMICPNCGNVRKRVSDVVMREGYLSELGRDGSQKASLNISHEIRQDWYSGLLYICMEKNYSQGWAAHKFKEKFGVWPNDYRKSAKPPSSAVRSWVRSRQIAYAKAKEKYGSTYEVM
jgi:superfamily II DNA or RNA helicase